MDLIFNALEIDSTSKSWLRWKARPRHHFETDASWMAFNTCFAGKEAGDKCVDGKGKPYWRVGISMKRYKAHRIVMALFTGSDLGDFQVDHADNDGLNNDPLNLRVAVQQQNSRNRGMQKNNTSGCKGVTRIKNRGKWEAKIQIDGKTLHLGYFEEIADAATAYDRAAREHFGEFYRPS